MEQHSLQLAPEKTEVVVLRGPWKKSSRETPVFVLKGRRLIIARAAKYLVIMIDDIGSFNVEYATKKAEGRVAQLIRIMRNIGGATKCKATDTM